MLLAIMMEEHAVTTKTLDGILTVPLVNVWILHMELQLLHLHLHLRHLVVQILPGPMTNSVMMEIIMLLAIMMEEHAVTTKCLDGILIVPNANVFNTEEELLKNKMLIARKPCERLRDRWTSYDG